MPTAMLMTMTRAILQAEAGSPRMPTPESILQNTNIKLLADLVQAGMFVTVFVGQYHPTSEESEYFGVNCLLKQVQQLKGQSAMEISDTLLTTVASFSGSEPQADDQLILVLRCTGH